MFLILAYIGIIKLTFVDTRQYATEFLPLVKALQKIGATTTNTTRSQRVPNTKATKPVVILPYDLEQFHKQLTTNWTTYVAEQQISPLTPGLSVNPDCNCYNYHKIR